MCRAATRRRKESRIGTLPGVRPAVRLFDERPVLAAILGALTIAFSAIFVSLADVSPATAAFFRCAYALPPLALIAVLERFPTFRIEYRFPNRHGRTCSGHPRSTNEDVEARDGATGMTEMEAYVECSQRPNCRCDTD